MLEWLRTRRGTDNQNDWPTIVFLLQVGNVLTADDAVRMCQAAWGAAVPVKLIGVVSEGHYALEASPLFFAFHSVAARYPVDGLHLSQVQQQCWDGHSAWMSVDLMRNPASELRKAGTLAQAYKTLLYFVFKHWSPSCPALYFPCEGVTLPNHGDLVESIRWCGRNGIDLTFLK